jgi:hypothetical protein
MAKIKCCSAYHFGGLEARDGVVHPLAERFGLPVSILLFQDLRQRFELIDRPSNAPPRRLGCV